MVKKIILLCLLIATVLLVTLSSVFVTDTGAYKSDSYLTHQWIFEQANKILGNDGVPYHDIATFLNSSDPDNPGDTYLETLIRGSDERDSLIDAREHHMDPTDHDGLNLLWEQFKSAGKLCQERFDNAVNAWLAGEKSDAMYELGGAAHLVQDVCVPHHAFPKVWEYPSSHADYEDWVENNMANYAVDSGGTYSFSSFPDYEYYEANGEYQDHYVWDSAFAWVDYNAHESIKHFARVNDKLDGYVTDDYNVTTVHDLDNNLVAWWNITEYGVAKMRLRFKTIDMQTGDYVRIYDVNDNLQISYTGEKSDELTPEVTGNTINIKIETDSSTRSWGYQTEELEYYDVGDDLDAATDVLLKRAQRTTAGFIHFFFQKVGVDLWIENKNAKTLRILGQTRMTVPLLI